MPRYEVYTQGAWLATLVAFDMGEAEQQARRRFGQYLELVIRLSKDPKPMPQVPSAPEPNRPPEQP